MADSSALLGHPPNTQDDYWIARGMLRLFGLFKADPHKGVMVLPRPPPSRYHLESNGPGIIAGASVSIAIMIAITGTRLAIRYFKRRLIWGWDDWFIIPGVIFAVAWAALQIAIVPYGGGGRHIYDVTYQEFYIFYFVGMVDLLVFFPATGFVKMSITCFNMRITGLTSKGWMIAHQTFLAVLFSYNLAAVLTIVFYCSPARATFDLLGAGKLPGPQKCGGFNERNRLATAFNIFHIGSDFCLLSVPIIVLWKVQMHWATKMRLFFVFSIGAVSSIASVMRQIADSKPRLDETYEIPSLINWVLVELTFGVMAASLPVLSALIPSPFKSQSGSGRRLGYFGASSRLPHISSNSSNPSGQGAQPLKSKGSQEGILREDEVELHFQTSGPLGEPDRGSDGGLGLHTNNDSSVRPSSGSTYPEMTYPPAAVTPKRSSRQYNFTLGKLRNGRHE